MSHWPLQYFQIKYVDIPMSLSRAPIADGVWFDKNIVIKWANTNHLYKKITKYDFMLVPKSYYAEATKTSIMQVK